MMKLRLVVVGALLALAGCDNPRSSQPSEQPRQQRSREEPAVVNPAPAPVKALEPVAPTIQTPPSPAEARDRAFQAKTKAGEKFDATADGKRLSAEVTDLLAKLEAARKTRDPNQYLPASSAYNKARLRLEALRTAAQSSDQDVIRTEAEMQEIERKASAMKSAEAERKKSEAALQERLRKPIGNVNVGSFGLLTEAVKIQQILGPKEMIVDYGDDTIWLQGISTYSMVDGKAYRLNEPIRIVGTRQYQTVLGSTRTVYEGRPAK